MSSVLVTPTNHLPLRVVIFASEQLVPALQFLLHVASQMPERLQAVHIYHTDDERRSAAPARRLQATLLAWSNRRGQALDVRMACGQMQPEDVRNVLMHWFEQAPGSEWLLNITGGTKPMAAAALELTLSTNLPHRRVLYQEIDGRWSELLPGEDGLLNMVTLQATTDPMVSPQNALDRLLPINDLVATQFSEDHEIVSDALHKSLAVDAVTQTLIQNGWKWTQALQGFPDIAPNLSNGTGFELFLGAGLQACGVKLRHSLKVRELTGKKTVVREIDLVACHKGRLVCIDIKLPGAQEHLKGTQLADVAELAHSLGGRNALAVAIRPGWAADESTYKLAKALGVRLLTQAQAARPFSTLLEWLDSSLTLSPEVMRCEQQLQAHQTMGNDVLSDGRLVERIQATHSGSLHLPTMIEKSCEHRGEPWALVQMQPQMYWLGIPKMCTPLAAQQDWPERSLEIRRMVDEVSVWGDKRYHFQETPSWLSALFITKAGIRQADLMVQLRRLLPTFRTNEA